MSVQKAIDYVEEAEIWLRDALEELPVTTGRTCSSCGQPHFTQRERQIHKSRLSLEGQVEKVRRLGDTLKEA